MKKITLVTLLSIIVTSLSTTSTKAASVNINYATLQTTGVKIVTSPFKRYITDPYPTFSIDVTSDVELDQCVFVVSGATPEVNIATTPTVLSAQSYRCTLNTAANGFSMASQGAYDIELYVYDTDYNSYNSNNSIGFVRDTTAPVSGIKSAIRPTESTFSNNSVNVYFTGTDASPIEYIDLYYSLNNGPWTKYGSRCGLIYLMLGYDIPCQFFIQQNGTYRIYGIANDYAGNIEAKSTADITINVDWITVAQATPPKNEVGQPPYTEITNGSTTKTNPNPETPATEEGVVDENVDLENEALLEAEESNDIAKAREIVKDAETTTSSEGISKTTTLVVSTVLLIPPIAVISTLVYILWKKGKFAGLVKRFGRK